MVKNDFLQNNQYVSKHLQHQVEEKRLWNQAS